MPGVSAKSGGLTPRDVFDDLQTPRPALLAADSASDVVTAAGAAALLAAKAEWDSSEARSTCDAIKALHGGDADPRGDASVGAASVAAVAQQALARAHSESQGAASPPLDAVVDVFATPRPGAAAPFGSPQVQG